MLSTSTHDETGFMRLNVLLSFLRHVLQYMKSGYVVQNRFLSHCNYMQRLAHLFNVCTAFVFFPARIEDSGHELDLFCNTNAILACVMRDVVHHKSLVL